MAENPSFHRVKSSAYSELERLPVSSWNLEVMNDSNCGYGNGNFEFCNGDTYTGSFEALKAGIITREGNGVYTSSDGHVYDGFWASDLVDCPNATINFPDGSRYIGSLRKMKCHGNGCYFFPDGTSIEAKFCNNVMVEDGDRSTHIVFVDKSGIQWFGGGGHSKITMLPKHHFIPRGWKVTDEHVPHVVTEKDGVRLRKATPEFSFLKFREGTVPRTGPKETSVGGEIQDGKA